MQHRLIAVAHGTAAALGRRTAERLVDAVRAARPDVPVELCFLDVVDPRLPDLLARPDTTPAVIVPLLLSTGYHVQSDIPGAAAAYPHVTVARHLGPHPLVVDALADRLAALPGGAASIVLVGAGSTRSDAAAELAETAHLLARRTAQEVTAATLGDGLPAALAAARPPAHVATYLLAEGRFTATLGAVAAQAGVAAVAAPLGVHPALVELVWQRYDEAARTARVL